ELLEASGKFSPNIRAVRAKGQVVDLHTPVRADTPIVAIDLTDPEAPAVIRRWTAHVLADAVQRLYPGTKITFGPAIDNGFYYDFDRKDGQFTEADFEVIENKMR